MSGERQPHPVPCQPLQACMPPQSSLLQALHALTEEVSSCLGYTDLRQKLHADGKVGA
jgi:hypothetical protein